MSDVSAPPAGGRRERKRAQTLDHLADTAWALFEARGFEAVTMEAIAEAADVAKGTLYKHFPVKEALLQHRMRRDLAADMAQGRSALMGLPGTEARLRAFLARSAEWTLRYRHHMAHYLRHRLSVYPVAAPQDPAQRSGMDQAFEALLAAGLAQGDLAPGQDPQRLSQVFQSLYLTALLRWLADPTLSLVAEFDAAVDFFMHGAGGR